MKQPRLSRLMTWERHVNLVLTVLLRALAILQTRARPSDSEITLNRELYFCLLEANNQLLKASGEAINHAPVPEGKNPPDPDDVKRAKRENKIPDFYWGFIDHTADPRRSARYFFIECKRLGKPLRLDWIFNENYIHDGVQRFITEEHAYAKGEKAAAMVGYVQSMDLPDILSEVNTAAGAVSVALLSGPVGGWKKGGISKLEHDLTRPFHISPLYLQHFWLDCRP